MSRSNEVPVADVRARLLSRLIGRYRSRDAADLDQVFFASQMYGGQEPCRNVPGTSACGSMARLGLTRIELNEQWEGLHFTQRAAAQFPDHLIAQLIHPSVWPIVDQMIMDGPSRATAKIEAAIYRYSQRAVRPTVARPEGGKVTRRSVRHKHEIYRRMLRELVALRALEIDSPDLDKWVVVPPIEMPNIVPMTTDRSAPPLDLVRAVLHDLDKRVNERLGATDGDKVAAVRRLSTVELYQSGVATDLRALAVISLLACHAPRIGALAALGVADYDAQHRFPDGEVGPALRYHPGKGEHARLARWKGLPPKEAHLVEAHVMLRRRLYCERVPTKKGSWRVLREPRDLPKDSALLAAHLFEPSRFPNPQALSMALAGQGHGFAWLPLPENLADRKKGRTGLPAHRMRHFGEQQIRTAINDWLIESRSEHVNPRAVADAVLDHRIEDDPYGYADVGSERGREIWTRLAAKLVSERLWTDVAARRKPDLEAFDAACAARAAVAKRLVELEATRSHLRMRLSADGADAGSFQQFILMSEDAVALRRQLHDADAVCERLSGDRSTWLIIDPGSPVEQAEQHPQTALGAIAARYAQSADRGAVFTLGNSAAEELPGAAYDF